MELKGKNESTSMKLKPKETGGGHEEVVATLKWTAAVDLDLHVHYSLKGAVLQPAKKGLLGIGRSPAKMSGEGIISFRNFGSLTSAPFIKLDKDSGVGDAGGDNEENVHFTDLSKIGHALIVANIYGKLSSNFAKYDGKVIVKCGDQVVEVPLIESTPGSYCIVAHIDNTGSELVLRNINKVQSKAPTIAEFLSS